MKTDGGRQLGLFAAIALVMGNMIGSGVFLLPASLAPYGWNAVGAWVLTIGGSLVLALVLARLAAARPASGGPVEFVREAFGPVPAYLIGWVYLISIWTAVVTIAVAAVSYLSSMIPQISAIPFGPALVAVALLWLFTLVNLAGVRSAGQVQMLTLALKLIPLVVVAALAIGALSSGTAHLPPFDMADLSGPALGGAATLTLWALLGFECASVAAAKVANPAVNVPRATLWGTALTGLLYLVVCSAIAMLLPPEVASASPAPFSTFVERFWSAGPATLIGLFAIISCFGALNGWTLLQGELPRAMAEKGMLPRWFAGTDRRGTPANALIASAVIASLFALINGTRSMQGLFEYLLLLSTSAALWLYLAFALAAIRLKIAPLWAGIGVVYSLWTLWGAGVEASGLSLVLMLSGLPLYWWSRRGSAQQAVEP